MFVLGTLAQERIRFVKWDSQRKALDVSSLSDVMKVSSLLMNWCLLTEPFISKRSQKEFFLFNLNTFSSNNETMGKL